MNYNTVYVGMDVHKESFTLCSCKYEDEKGISLPENTSQLQECIKISCISSLYMGEDTRFCVATKQDALGILFVSSIGKILMWNV